VTESRLISGLCCGAPEAAIKLQAAFRNFRKAGGIFQKPSDRPKR
jgi:hypothetical protein